MSHSLDSKSSYRNEAEKIKQLNKVKEKLDEVAFWIILQDGSIEKTLHHSDFKLALSTLGYDYGSEIMDRVLTLSKIVENGFVEYSNIYKEVELQEKSLESRYNKNVAESRDQNLESSHLVPGSRIYRPTKDAPTFYSHLKKTIGTNNFIYQNYDEDNATAMRNMNEREIEGQRQTRNIRANMKQLTAAYKQFDAGYTSVPQFLEYIQSLGIIVTPDARHEIRCNHNGVLSFAKLIRALSLVEGPMTSVYTVAPPAGFQKETYGSSTNNINTESTNKKHLTTLENSSIFDIMTAERKNNLQEKTLRKHMKDLQIGHSRNDHIAPILNLEADIFIKEQKDIYKSVANPYGRGPARFQPAATHSHQSIYHPNTTLYNHKGVPPLASHEQYEKEIGVPVSNYRNLGGKRNSIDNITGKEIVNNNLTINDDRLPLNKEIKHNSASKFLRQQIIACARGLEKGIFSATQFLDKIFFIGADLTEEGYTLVQSFNNVGLFDFRQFVNNMDKYLYIPDFEEHNPEKLRKNKLRVDELLTRLKKDIFSSQVSPTELQKLKVYFESLDEDDTGSLTFCEFQKALEYKLNGFTSVGNPSKDSISYQKKSPTYVTVQDIQLLYDHFDYDKDGDVTYQEFIRAIRGDHTLSKYRKDLLYRVFRCLDRTGNGILVRSNLREAYNGTQHPDCISGKRSAEEIKQEFIDTFNVNTDARYDEDYSFLHLWNKDDSLSRQICYTGGVSGDIAAAATLESAAMDTPTDALQLKIMKERGDREEREKSKEVFVTLDAFLDYYSNLSALISDDNYFKALATHPWGLSINGEVIDRKDFRTGEVERFIGKLPPHTHFLTKHGKLAEKPVAGQCHGSIITWGTDYSSLEKSNKGIGQTNPFQETVSAKDNILKDNKRRIHRGPQAEGINMIWNDNMEKIEVPNFLGYSKGRKSDVYHKNNNHISHLEAIFAWEEDPKETKKSLSKNEIGGKQKQGQHISQLHLYE